MRGILTFVLAGGRGERLNPLTQDRAKPAVPFAGNYRIIDFTLSNCVNSGLRRIYILTQYKSFSLQKHLLAGWDVVSNQLGEFIDVIPAQQRISTDWYRGTADAIFQNIYAINDCNPEHILILAGDHIYKMNYMDMIKKHKENGADVTMACLPMPKNLSTSFGVVQADEDNRVHGFQEKPKNPETIPGSPDQIYASMGIYFFSKETLLEELGLDSQNMLSSHDFGKNIIPQMIKSNKKVFAYSFKDENGNPQYWRDIGTRDAYYQANLDLLDENPEFDLYDKSWPVRTFHEQYPPNKIVKTASGNSHVVNSILSGGCVIKGATVERSIIAPNVKIEDRAEVLNSVIMDNVVIGARAKVRNAIIDKETVVFPDAHIGYNLELDKKRFAITSSGVIIVPKRAIVKE